METLENFNPAYQSKTGNWSKREQTEQETEIEKSIFYDMLRQQGANSLALTIELKSQILHSVPVRDIDEVYYHPDKGIYLFFRAGQIHIEGRNLQPLAMALINQRVTIIRDYYPKADILFDERVLVITAIHYESENLDAL